MESDYNPESDVQLEHVEKTYVEFMLLGPDPDLVTQRLKIDPTRTEFYGDIMNKWVLSTETKLSTKVVDEHFGFLLQMLLPKIDEIEALHPASKLFFVDWTADYNRGILGPSLTANTIAGINLLKAGVGFTLYPKEEAGT